MAASRSRRARSCCSRTAACNKGEKKNKRRTGAEDGRAVRHLRATTPSAPPTAPKPPPTASPSTPRWPAPAPLLGAEIDALTKALHDPKRPLVAIVGGSKVSSKLTILKSLADKVDQLIVGGGIANTFLLASGKRIGDSLAEPDLVKEAQAIMDIDEGARRRSAAADRRGGGRRSLRPGPRQQDSGRRGGMPTTASSTSARRPPPSWPRSSPTPAPSSGTARSASSSCRSSPAAPR